MSIAAIVGALITFYTWVIVAYVLMSWFRPSGALLDVYHILGTVCEPYLSLFRRFVPVAGGLDFSPWIAIIVLQLVGSVVVRALGAAGL